jgi:hypothetical protein
VRERGMVLRRVGAADLGWRKDATGGRGSTYGWGQPVGERDRWEGEVGRGCLLGWEGRWAVSSWASGKRKEKEGERELDWAGWGSRAVNGIWAELSWRPALAQAKRKRKRR